MSRYRPQAVVAGFAFVIAGAALHWPDFISAASMHYRMVGMPISPTMLAGMGLIGLGIALAAYGLIRPANPAEGGVQVRVETMDDRSLNGRDVVLLAILTLALVIDVMKPATLSFIIPGARAEYHLTTGQIALWPLSALTGTAIGSLAWGLLADRFGRRGGLLLAAVLFIGTSICGSMPEFRLNLVMCFVMGLSAGGMLPLVFALLAEIAPSRSRGTLAVLIGGLPPPPPPPPATPAAALLEPLFTWRVLWLIGLPTGALLVLFARFIPESPRFLVLSGRTEEARRTMREYGSTLEVVPAAAAPVETGASRAGVGSLLRVPYAAQTLALAIFGFAWGVANFGFLTWLPTLLRRGTANAATWNGVLAKSALIALPGALLVTWLYGRWRSRGSIVTFAILTSVTLTLLGVAIGRGGGGLLIGALAILLLIGINGSSAMLSVYTAEVFPTPVRGSGTGLVAAVTKFGGLLGPQLVALVLILGGGATVTAALVAVPLCLGGLLLWRRGVETRQRSLDEIQLAIHGAAR